MFYLFIYEILVIFGKEMDWDFAYILPWIISSFILLSWLDKVACQNPCCLLDALIFFFSS